MAETPGRRYICTSWRNSEWKQDETTTQLCIYISSAWGIPRFCQRMAFSLVYSTFDMGRETHWGLKWEQLKSSTWLSGQSQHQIHSKRTRGWRTKYQAQQGYLGLQIFASLPCETAYLYWQLWHLSHGNNNGADCSWIDNVAVKEAASSLARCGHVTPRFSFRRADATCSCSDEEVRSTEAEPFDKKKGQAMAIHSSNSRCQPTFDWGYYVPGGPKICLNCPVI